MVCHAGKRKAQSASLVMLVDVVPLRRYGNKLPGDVIAQASATRGELSIENHRARDGVGAQANFIVAKLAVAGGALPVPQLLYAVVTKMKGDSFLVAGLEVHIPKPQPGASYQCDQTWWCRVVTSAESKSAPGSSSAHALGDEEDDKCHEGDRRPPAARFRNRRTDAKHGPDSRNDLNQPAYRVARRLLRLAARLKRLHLAHCNSPPVERKHCPGGSPIGGKKSKKAEPNESRNCPAILGISA